MRIESESLAVASKVVHTAAVSLAMVQGYFNGSTANRWLQLHDAKALPANGAVPLRSWPLFMTAPFEQDFKTDHVSLVTGCVFAVSTTQATLTISADTMDLYVQGTSPWDNTGASVAGDYISAAEGLTVWAEASGPKRLLRVEVKDNAGALAYLQIHASDTPATDKIVASFPVTANGNLSFFFGEAGLVPFRKNAGVEYDGCTLAMSTAQATYVSPGATSWNLKATYI